MLLQLQTELEGKMVHFDHLRYRIQSLGYSIDGSWDFHKGSFDNVLWKDAVNTVYLKLPFEVLEGDLDHHEMYIKFQTPYVTERTTNVALDRTTPFQGSMDKIENQRKWQYVGEQAVEQIVRLVQ